MKATLNLRREQTKDIRIEEYGKLGGGFHFHSTVELLWVRRGATEVWINDTCDTVRENELAIVLGYEAHSFKSCHDDSMSTILFIPTHICPDFTEAVQNKRFQSSTIRDSKVTSPIIYAIEMLKSDHLDPIERKGYAHVILGTVLRYSKFEPVEAPAKVALPEKLLLYINEHFKEDVSIATIAQELGYNRHHLAKCFRSRFHISINNYINTLRLKNAVMLMQDKSKCITDCALESGFGSLRTFYRIFYDEFGCSPREYLKQY